MLMSWLSVIVTMLNWITSLQRKIQWSRWSMIAIESEFKLSRGFFSSFVLFLFDYFYHFIFLYFVFLRLCLSSDFFLSCAHLWLWLLLWLLNKNRSMITCFRVLFWYFKHTYTYFIINFDRLKISLFLFILPVKAI